VPTKFAAETIRYLRELGTGDWIIVYRRGEGPAVQVVTSGLLPLEESIKTTVNQSWSFDPFDLRPGCTCYGNRDPVYERFGNSKRYEPLVIERHFSSIRPDSLEILEEFRLYHNLSEDQSSQRFLKTALSKRLYGSAQIRSRFELLN
jgi:hypothetical protein